jgi:hypothetical protein
MEFTGDDITKPKTNKKPKNKHYFWLVSNQTTMPQ